MYTIESNKPIPPMPFGPRTAKYPFREMNVGDSFFCPCVGDERPAKTAQRLAVAAKAASVRIGNNCQFTVRSESDGARIWRVS